MGRIISALVTAGGWLLGGARLMLDLIGYSTAPEDAAVAQTRLGQILEWFLSIPWWALLGFALVSTLWLMWVSWPRKNVTAALDSEQNTVSGPEHSIDLSGLDSHFNRLDPFFSKKVIRLSDMLLDGEYMIEDKTFENCAIIGPAIIGIDPGKPGGFAHCAFSGNLESIFIEVAPPRNAQGVIGLSGCMFRSCKFQNIRIIGPPRLREKFAAGIS